MLEEVLKTVPRTYRLYDRDGGYITIGEGDVKCDSTDGPIYIRKEGKYDTPSHDHLVNFHIDISYVAPEVRNQYGLGVALRYCKNPCTVWF